MTSLIHGIPTYEVPFWFQPALVLLLRFACLDSHMMNNPIQRLTLMSLITAGFKPMPTVSRSPNQEQPCSVSQIEWNPRYPKNGRRQNFQQIFKKKSSNVYSTNLSAAKQTERNCWALKHYLQSAKRDHLVGIRKQKKLRRVSGEAKKIHF